MAQMWVWGDTVGRSTCRHDACRARITWAEGADSGRRMCFDGELVALKTEHRDGRVAWLVDLADNHWATCPGADQFRRTRKGGGA